MDTTTSILLNISIVIQIIVFIALIYFAVSMIKIIKGLKNKVDSFQIDFDNFKTKVDPAIDETLILLKKVNKVVDKIDVNILTIKGAVDKVKDTSSEIMDFVLTVKRKVEPSVMNYVTSITAFTKGTQAFFSKLKSDNERVELQDENFLFDEHLEDNNDTPIDYENEFKDINKELNEVRKKLEEMKRV